jgi:hypothetical protein
MFVFANFIADDAAHGGVLVLRRQAGATTQAEQRISAWY